MKTPFSFLIASALSLTMMISVVGCDNNDDDDNNATPGVNQSGNVGPGAQLSCASSGKNAWSTFGQNGFVAVNKSIFQNVANEMNANGTANLGDSFTKVGTGNPPSTKDDAASFEGNLAAFLIYVYGGPSTITYTDGKTYAGPQDMTTAHVGLNISGSQYDYFLSDIILPALKSNGVSDADIATCFAPPLLDPGFKASIVGH